MVGKFKKFKPKKFKKRFGKKALKKFKRIWDHKAEILTIPINRQGLVVPPLLRTKMNFHTALYIPGTTVSNPLVASFPINNCYQIQTTTIAPLSLNTLGTIYGQGSIAAAQLKPAGFANICGATALYYAYRVLAAKVTVSITPLIIGDSQYCCITAANSNASLPSVLITAADSPYSSKVIQCEPNTPYKSRQVSMFYKMHEIMGLTPQQYMADNRFQNGWNGVGTAGNVVHCGLMLQSVTNPTVATTSPVAVSVHVKYYVQFEVPNIGDILDA